MLLTLSTTHSPATDLGFLLHKHPDRVQSFPQSFGAARVFYPEATAALCTAALLLDVDPVGLVRRGRGTGGFALAEYVNDRPYVASSFMSVALVNVFKSAIGGTCRGHEELAASAIPLEASLPVVPARGGAGLVRRLFEPLGYAVTVAPIALDPEFPEWGDGRHVGLTLAAECRLADLLTHLYVLLPVLDDDKHYWVDEAEIDKLVRRGEGWLPGHPERELIVRRYLKNQASLFHPALARLEDEAAPEEDGEDGVDREERLEAPVALRVQRLDAVEAAAGVRRPPRARPRLRLRRPAHPAARRWLRGGRRRRRLDHAPSRRPRGGWGWTRCTTPSAAASPSSTARSPTATGGSPASTPPPSSR